METVKEIILNGLTDDMKFCDFIKQNDLYLEDIDQIQKIKSNSVHIETYMFAAHFIKCLSEKKTIAACIVDMAHYSTGPVYALLTSIQLSNKNMKLNDTKALLDSTHKAFPAASGVRHNITVDPETNLLALTVFVKQKWQTIYVDDTSFTDEADAIVKITAALKKIEETESLIVS